MFYYNKAAFTKTPQIEEGVYIKSGAVITGDVHIGTGSSIWHNAVLRGDTEESLTARILEAEHEAYPEAVRMVLKGEA